jgi:hypothetical protein
MQTYTRYLFLLLITIAATSCKCTKKAATTPTINATDTLVTDAMADMTPRRAYPEWVNAITDSIQAQPITNPPMAMWRYDYGANGAVVYYFSAPCCDQFSRLYNSEGTLIAYPDGGITGRGDGRMPDFMTTRTNGYVLWYDPRAPAPKASQTED